MVLNRFIFFYIIYFNKTISWMWKSIFVAAQIFFFYFFFSTLKKRDGPFRYSIHQVIPCIQKIWIFCSLYIMQKQYVPPNMPFFDPTSFWFDLRVRRYLNLWGTCWRLCSHCLAENQGNPEPSSQTNLFKTEHGDFTIETKPFIIYHIEIALAFKPFRPCLRNSLSCTNPANICVSMKTSRNLRRLLEDTALRKASRWNDEGVGEEEDEAEDSSSRSLPPIKSE